MHRIRHAALLSVVFVVSLTGCRPSPAPADSAAADTAPPASATGADPGWPADLPVFGEGFPNPGDPCRRIGESAATVNVLDDSAALVGCRSPEDAARLGGRIVATLEGVTLVSVPDAMARPGDGDGQGDARVAGTPYHATAELRCSGYKGAAAGLCKAGATRDPETGTAIEVTLPDGATRVIFFGPDGRFLAFGAAQADGTAAMTSGSRRDGDTTIATLDGERYEIPDAFVRGD